MFNQQNSISNMLFSFTLYSSLKLLNANQMPLSLTPKGALYAVPAPAASRGAHWNFVSGVQTRSGPTAVWKYFWTDCPAHNFSWTDFFLINNNFGTIQKLLGGCHIPHTPLMCAPVRDHECAAFVPLWCWQWRSRWMDQEDPRSSVDCKCP